MTAATFGIPSGELASIIPALGEMERLAASLPYSILPAPGGVPVLRGRLVVAGLGIAGPPPAVCRGNGRGRSSRRLSVRCPSGSASSAAARSAASTPPTSPSFPGVEVWAYDAAAEHVAAINRARPAHHRARRAGRSPSGAHRRRADPAVLARDPRDERDRHRARRSPRPLTVFADGAVCSVQNGIGNEEVIAQHVHA